MQSRVTPTSSSPAVLTPPSAPVFRAVRRPAPKPTPAALVTSLENLTLTEIVDEGAPEGAVAYLELLADALQDAELSAMEHAALQDIASIYDLTPEDIESANRAMLLTLCHLAMDDGRATVRERDELLHVAALLQVDPAIVRDLLAHATEAREARLAAGLLPLPSHWSGGEPLRVGDRVAFTGGDPDRRASLERRAQGLGVRVMGNVSRLTTVLVTDGSFVGAKSRKAAEHGTRLVGPDEFERLLAHLQPAVARTRPGVALREPTATKSSREGEAAAKAADGAAMVSAAPRTTQALPTEKPAFIREWARDNGFVVGVRGRLPAPVLEAYRAAHPPRAVTAQDGGTASGAPSSRVGRP